MGRGAEYENEVFSSFLGESTHLAEDKGNVASGGGNVSEFIVDSAGDRLQLFKWVVTAASAVGDSDVALTVSLGPHTGAAEGLASAVLPNRWEFPIPVPAVISGDAGDGLLLLFQNLGASNITGVRFWAEYATKVGSVYAV